MDMHEFKRRVAAKIMEVPDVSGVGIAGPATLAVYLAADTAWSKQRVREIVDEAAIPDVVLVRFTVPGRIRALSDTSAEPDTIWPLTLPSVEETFTPATPPEPDPPAFEAGGGSYGGGGASGSYDDSSSSSSSSDSGSSSSSDSSSGSSSDSGSSGSSD